MWFILYLQKHMLNKQYTLKRNTYFYEPNLYLLTNKYRLYTQTIWWRCMYFSQLATMWTSDLRHNYLGASNNILQEAIFVKVTSSWNSLGLIEVIIFVALRYPDETKLDSSSSMQRHNTCLTPHILFLNKYFEKHM